MPGLKTVRLRGRGYIPRPRGWRIAGMRTSDALANEKLAALRAVEGGGVQRVTRRWVAWRPEVLS